MENADFGTYWPTIENEEADADIEETDPQRALIREERDKLLVYNFELCMDNERLELENVFYDCELY